MSIPDKQEGVSRDVEIHQTTLKPRKWWQFGGKDVSHVSVDDGYHTPGSSTPSLSDTSSLDKNVNNVYEDSEAAEFYKPIEGYEGAHRFVPDASWSVSEENALRRKV